MQVMIALVGEQPLPNFLPVRFYKPASVLFVYTGRTKRVYERLHTTLSREAQIYGLEVEPFDIVAVTRKIQARLEELALDDTMLLFNVTGGTKAMALAAYQIAQQRAASILYLESEGKQSCAYTYTWAGQTPQHHSRGSIPPCVTLNDLLDIYCGPKQWFIAGPNRLEGGPFEIAIADALREHVDELYIGVKAFGGQVDLDQATEHRGSAVRHLRQTLLCHHRSSIPWTERNYQLVSRPCHLPSGVQVTAAHTLHERR
jgi:hypothetical protein